MKLLNCPNCVTGNQTGRAPKKCGKFLLARTKTEPMSNHHQYQCPNCRACFWLPIDQAAEFVESFNPRVLTPAMV